ncbi:MAG: hypothetical protein K0R70_425, partial [Steroidobacteraceae bacterium]|nr:hypothetical protein [Steroidobacteraceae bacterium]
MPAVHGSATMPDLFAGAGAGNMAGESKLENRPRAGSARAPDLPALPKAPTGIEGLDEILGGG